MTMESAGTITGGIGPRETTITEKSDYIKRLVAEELTFPDEVIAKMKWFKANHKEWKEGDSRDFYGVTASRAAGMQELILAFCSVYQMEPVELRTRDIVPGGSSGGSFYSTEGYIMMHGKLSIITLLHEFCHAMGYEKETDAHKWSVSLYKKIYPKAYEQKLCMGSDDPNSVYLITKEEKEKRMRAQRVVGEIMTGTQQHDGPVSLAGTDFMNPPNSIMNRQIRAAALEAARQSALASQPIDEAVPETAENGAQGTTV